MAYSYLMLDKAKEDYEGIVAYLIAVSDGSSAALSFIDEFDRQIQIVCSNLSTYGLPRTPEIATLGYHTMLINNYAAFYFFRNSTVFAAHIFHQRQDYAKLVAGQATESHEGPRL